MISLIWSTPPRLVLNLPSNVNSLCLFVTIGFKIAPDPLPPDNVTDKTLSISKFCWSTKTSSNVPVTTGWIKAVVPAPAGAGTLIWGGFITSKFLPGLKIMKSDNGP